MISSRGGSRASGSAIASSPESASLSPTTHGDRSSRARGDAFDRRFRGWGVQRGVLSQDRLFELLDRGAGLDPELVDEQASRVSVDVERLCLASRPVERQHELCAKRLAIRMLPGERLELADELCPAAEGEVGVDATFEGDEAELFEAADLCLRERLAGQVGECGAAPEAEGLAEEPRCVSGGAFCASARSRSKRRRSSWSGSSRIR